VLARSSAEVDQTDMGSSALATRLAALAAVAASALACTAWPAANAADAPSRTVGGTGFGGRTHVRPVPIDRDLAPAGATTLHRVRCLGATDPATRCWIGT
jgi:hypothetical protein